MTLDEMDALVRKSAPERPPSAPDRAAAMSEPPAPGPSRPAISIDDMDKMMRGSTGTDAAAGRAAAERSDPRFAAPVAPGQQQPGENQLDFADRQMRESHQKKQEGAGILANLGNSMNEHIANLGGAYADNVQGPMIGMAVSAWKALRGDQKELLAKDHPKEAAAMDFFQRMAEHPILGSEMLKGIMSKSTGTVNLPLIGKVGGSAYDPNMAPPVNLGERMAKAAGPAVVDAATLGLGAEAFAARTMAPVLLERTGLAKTLESYGITSESVANMLKGGGFRNNVVMGGVGGAAGEAAKEAAPEPLKPLAEAAGNFAGGFGAAVAESSAVKFIRSLAESAFGSAKMAAGEALRPTAEDVSRLRNFEDNNKVPGLDPTTGQATGNQTQLGQEARVGGAKFDQREAQNNTARLNSIDQITDPDVAAKSVQDYIKDGLDKVKSFFAGNVGQAAHEAADAVTVGGGGVHSHPDEYAGAVQTRLGELYGEEQAKRTKLYKAVEPDETVPVNVDQLKKDVKGLYDTGNKAQAPPKGEEGRFFKTVSEKFDSTEPFGTLITLREDLVKEIQKVRGKNSDPKALQRLTSMLDSVDDSIAVHAGDKARTPTGKTKLTSDLAAVDRPPGEAIKVGDADVVKNPNAEDVMQMSRDNPNSQVVVHRDPDTGVTHAWVGDKATNQGVIEGISPNGNDTFHLLTNRDGVTYHTNTGEAPEDVARRTSDFLSGGAKVAEVPPTSAAKTSVLDKEQATGSPVLYGVRKFGGGNSQDVFVTRSKSAANAERKRLAEEDGVQSTVIPYRPKEGAVITPTERNAKAFDHSGEDGLYGGRAARSEGLINEQHLESQLGSQKGVKQGVADRFDEADTAGNSIRDTYETGPVGEALHPGQDEGTFRMKVSAVARDMFDQPAKLAAYVKAAAGDRELLGTLQDWAAFSMRKAATRDGIISPQKLSEWMADHQHVMDQFPELRAKFDNIRTAQAASDQAVANQKAGLKAYQDGAVGKIMGAKEADIPSVIGQTLKDPAEFGALVDQVRAADPAGLHTGPDGRPVDSPEVAGLKRGVIEHMWSSGRGNVQGSINGDNIRAYLTKYADSLSKLFSPEELATFKNAAREFDEASRVASAPGNSSGKTMTVLGWLARHGAYKALFAVAGGAGALSHGVESALLVGGAAGLAGTVADRIAASRLARFEEAMTDILLDRREAEAVFSKVLDRASARESISQIIDRRMRTAAFNSVLQTAKDYDSRPLTGAAERAVTELHGGTPGPFDRGENVKHDALHSLSFGLLGTADPKIMDVKPSGSYPGQEELDLARKVDQSYGDKNSSFFEPGQADLRQVAAALAPMVAADKRWADVPWKSVDKPMADMLYTAGIAANRSALASLGFDPRKFVVSPPSDDKLTHAGLYYPKRDVGWVDANTPSALVHESIHRGIEQLKQDGVIATGYNDPNGAGKLYVSDANEEELVRATMLKNFGGVEKGNGPEGDRQISEAENRMKYPDFMDMVNKLETLAAEQIRKRRPMGPR